MPRRESKGDFDVPAARDHVPAGGSAAFRRRFSVVKGAPGSLHVAGRDRQHTIAGVGQGTNGCRAYVAHLYVRKPTGDIVQVGSGSVFFDPARYLVEQLWATSKDRTRVPYFVVRSRDMVFDGSTLVMMRGYGANGESQLPTYLGGVTGTHWLGRGGAYVLANIRGGGEFGPAWHAAARREKRQNAYDDFQAVAADLIRRRITSPPRLGIVGGSGGGLLMGVSLTQRPDLFGAVVGLQPVLDLKRCTGYAAVAERGDPTDPRDWSFIRKWTPYHNVSRTAKYPPVYLQTNRRDDVVHPCHARKFAARLEEIGHRVLLYETETGGHPGAIPMQQRGTRWRGN